MSNQVKLIDVVYHNTVEIKMLWKYLDFIGTRNPSLTLPTATELKHLLREAEAEVDGMYPPGSEFV